MRLSTIAVAIAGLAIGAQALAIPSIHDLVARDPRRKAKSKKVASASKVSYGGVNIAGFDFGCTTAGVCPLTSTTNPGSAGIAQMNHFVTNDGLNAFRIPTSWQFLVGNVLGGTLNAANLAEYDAVMQACLSVADLCILDIHNYGRWNNQTVGQSNGAVTDAHFVSLWTQLATKYKSNKKVAFALMNEPHSLNISTWAQTLQQVVTAIRGVVGNTHTILLAGTDYSSAGAFLYDGSSTALSAITNPDGSTKNLVFDLHLYLDTTGSGTATTCVTNGTDSFAAVAKWLRAQGRMAFLSETGGGSTSSCIQYLCEELAYLNANNDVFMGYTNWGAGAFSVTYALSNTPFGSGANFSDQEIVSQCVAKMFTSS